MNNNNTLPVTLPRAKANLDKAGNAIQKRLLVLRDSGRIDLNSEAVSRLYYFHPQSNNQPSFEKALAVATKEWSGTIKNDGVLHALANELRAGYAVVTKLAAEEKARLEAKRAERSARGAQREALGVDLKKSGGKATVATYKAIRSELAAVEAHYVKYQTESLGLRFKALGELTEKQINDRSLWTEVNFFYSLERGRGGPGVYTRTPRTDLSARIAKRAKEEAAEIVASFAAKLAGKVDGDSNGASVVSATVSSVDLWSHSLLEVRLSDGSAQSWYTQMIINRSCLGKFFNQWPTRRTA